LQVKNIENGKKVGAIVISGISKDNTAGCSDCVKIVILTQHPGFKIGFFIVTTI